MKLKPEDFDRMLRVMYHYGANPEWTFHTHPVTGEQKDIDWNGLDAAGVAAAVKSLRDGGFIK